MAVENDDYKSGVARVSLDLIDGIHLLASGLYAMHGEESLRTLGHLGIEGSFGSSRFLLEGLAGQDGTLSDLTTDMGFGISAAHDLKLESDRFDHLTFLGRYMLYDPSTPLAEGYPDAGSVIGAAAWAYWKTDESHNFGTGLSYEQVVPQNLDLSVEHAITLETAWRR